MYNSRCINPENTHQIGQCRLLEGCVHCKTIKWKNTHKQVAFQMDKHTGRHHKELYQVFKHWYLYTSYNISVGLLPLEKQKYTKITEKLNDKTN